MYCWKNMAKNAKLNIYDIRSIQVTSNSLYYFFNIGWKNYFLFTKRRENNADVQSWSLSGDFLKELRKIKKKKKLIKKNSKKKKKKIFYHIRFNQTKVKYSILLCSLGWEHCIIFRKFGENNVDVQSFDPYRKERRYSERSAQN